MQRKRLRCLIQTVIRRFKSFAVSAACIPNFIDSYEEVFDTPL